MVSNDLLYKSVCLHLSFSLYCVTWSSFFCLTCTLYVTFAQRPRHDAHENKNQPYHIKIISLDHSLCVCLRFVLFIPSFSLQFHFILLMSDMYAHWFSNEQILSTISWFSLCLLSAAVLSTKKKKEKNNLYMYRTFVCGKLLVWHLFELKILYV